VRGVHGRCTAAEVLRSLAGQTTGPCLEPGGVQQGVGAGDEGVVRGAEEHLGHALLLPLVQGEVRCKRRPLLIRHAPSPVGSRNDTTVEAV
jgi:hypothetical protein